MPHLCQPQGVACGACCGMYNLEDLDPARVQALLNARTAAFEARCDPRDPTTLLGFRAAREAVEAPLAAHHALRNCPFLGWIDPAKKRPGCLIHPSRHGGVDARDCGAYDKNTCDGFLCSAHLAPKNLARLVLEACHGDAYLYGLILNDGALLNALLDALRLLDAPTDLTLRSPKVIDAARAFFLLKRDWPYRDPDATLVGQRLPDDFLALARLSSDLPPDATPQDRLLHQLGTDPDDPDLHEARAILSACIHDLAVALKDLTPRPPLHKWRGGDAE